MFIVQATNKLRLYLQILDYPTDKQTSLLLTLAGLSYKPLFGVIYTNISLNIPNFLSEKNNKLKLKIQLNQIVLCCDTFDT